MAQVSTGDVIQLPDGRYARRLPGGGQQIIANPRHSDALKDRSTVIEEGDRQADRARETLDEQLGIQRDRLAELTQLLASEEHRKFNQAIPEIAESAQGAGFLETSGFGNALARERANLAGQTQYELGRQALSDRDLEIAGIGNIGNIRNQFGTAGLERQFSVMDQARSEELSRELAKMGVANTSSSGSKNFLDNYGPALIGGIGAVAGGPGFGAGGAFNKSGGGSGGAGNEFAKLF